SSFSFFFSSRRRHTRSKRDWSSDVCSSDLNDAGGGLVGNFDFVGLKGLLAAAPLGGVAGESAGIPPLAFVGFQAVFAIITVALRSEERRVGKGCRSRWSVREYSQESWNRAL